MLTNIRQNFTLGPEHLDAVVDVSQVGSRGDPAQPTPLYLHRDPQAWCRAVFSIA